MCGPDVRYDMPRRVQTSTVHSVTQSARMSKIKTSGLDQYGTEPFERQQFGTAGVEWVKAQSEAAGLANVLARSSYIIG